MSEEERYIIQGRARDELKKLKSDVASLTASLNSKGASLKELGAILETISSDYGNHPNGELMQNSLKGRLYKIEAAEIAAEVEELFHHSRKLKSLQEQVDKF